MGAPKPCHQVSGVGNDAIFMGVMRRYEIEPGVIRVWLMPSGVVVCVDERFVDSECVFLRLVTWGCSMC